MVITHRKACLQCNGMEDVSEAMQALAQAGFTTITLYIDHTQAHGQGRLTVEGKWEGLRHGGDITSLNEMLGGKNW